MKKTVYVRPIGLIILIILTVAIISWTNYFLKKPSYRDLNKNGRMDVYEDKTQPTEKRVTDLLHQMTLEEKAGMMFINGARVNEDGSIEDKPATGLFAFATNGLKLMREKKMNHFNLWAIPSPEPLAKWYKCMQKYAEDSTRLGIPITI